MDTVGVLFDAARFALLAPAQFGTMVMLILNALPFALIMVAIGRVNGGRFALVKLQFVSVADALLND